MDNQDNGVSRLDRLERMIQTLGEAAQGLVKHAEDTDKRIDANDRQIQILRQVALETNERIASLVSAIGDYVRTQQH